MTNFKNMKFLLNQGEKGGLFRGLNYMVYVHKTSFFSLKLDKTALCEGQILTKNVDFGGYIPTFRAESTGKIRYFKFKNNSLTHSEQH